jgi:dystrophin
MIYILLFQNIKDNLQQISGRIDIIHKKKTAALQSATSMEKVKVQEAVAQMDFQGEKLHRMYKERQG